MKLIDIENFRNVSNDIFIIVFNEDIKNENVERYVKIFSPNKYDNPFNEVLKEYAEYSILGFQFKGSDKELRLWIGNRKMTELNCSKKMRGEKNEFCRETQEEK